MENCEENSKVSELDFRVSTKLDLRVSIRELGWDNVIKIRNFLLIYEFGLEFLAGSLFPAIFTLIKPILSQKVSVLNIN